VEHQRGDSATAFQGKVLSVRVDPVWAKSGPTTREVVVRGPAVGIVAETPEGSLVILRQYRWAIQQYQYELPAGMVEAHESPVQAAVRELREETGWQAGRIRPIFRYFTSPGYTTEEIFLYFADHLTMGSTQPDPDEELEILTWTRGQARDKLANPDSSNAILLVGLLWWLSV